MPLEVIVTDWVDEYVPATGENDGVVSAPLMVYVAEPTALSKLSVKDAIAFNVNEDATETVPPLAIDEDDSVGVVPSVV